MSIARSTALVVAAVGCGLVGGVFFAFSTFVLRALARLPPAQGIVAMQSINVTAVSPAFMSALFGTAVACLATAIASAQRWGEAGAVAALAGSLLYLIGTIAVTIVFNVPRNDALAAVDPASAEGARLWADYLRSWTSWNHVRTVASMAAAVLLTWSLVGQIRR